jgi:hypothetical protein
LKRTREGQRDLALFDQCKPDHAHL